MVYECEECAATLPARIMACPKCGLAFDEPVPSDAEVPGRGWKPKTEVKDLPPETVLSTITVWRLIAFDDRERATEMADWIRGHGVLAIGWGQMGDLRRQHFQTETDLRRIVADAYPNGAPSNKVNGGRSLWRLYSEMHIGDLVIISAAGSRVQTMRVTGDYYYVNHGDDPTHHYEHRRKAEVVPIDPNRLWHVTGGAAQGEGIFSTLVRCGQPLSVVEVNALTG